MRSTIASVHRALLILACFFVSGCGGSGSGSGFGSSGDRSDANSGRFGSGLAALGDLDGDGLTELAVGIPGFNGRSEDQGAVDVLFLEGDGGFELHPRIRSGESGFSGDLDRFDSFGQAVATLGDLDGDSVPDLAVGTPDDDDGKSGAGAVWIVFLQATGVVKANQKISGLVGGFTGNLDTKDAFGSSVALVGDLDGDGFVELAVGAPADDDGGGGRGAVWLLSLNPDGSGRQTRKISSLEGGFSGPLGNADHFGAGLAALGDLDLDGIPDLAVGAPIDEDGGFASGAVWILFLNADGTVKSQQKISATQGGLSARLHGRDQLGASVGVIGDLNADGIPDLAVGAPGTDGKLERGALWIIFLQRDGTALSSVTIKNESPGLIDELEPLGRFGSAVSGVGDIDSNGVLDVAVGAVEAGSGGQNSGGVWFLFLRTDGTVRDSRITRPTSTQ